MSLNNYMPSKKESSSEENNMKKEIREKTDEEVENILKDTLKKYKERKKINQENAEVIGAIIEEYLQSFLLVGYNYNGDMITYSHATSQIQADAVNHALLKITSQREIPPPNSSKQ